MHLDGNEGYLLIAHKPQKRYSGLKGGGGMEARNEA